MSKRYLILMIVTMIFTTSCSKYTTVVKPVKQDNIPPAEAIQVEVKEKEQIIEDSEIISREQAGLSIIPAKDISNIAINNRIEAILKGGEYLNSYYSSGIVQSWDGLIINERFTENIIGNISVGLNITEIINLLGEPSFKEKDYIFYKTDKLYMAFKGTDKLETAILRNIPKKYDQDILNKIIAEFTKEEKVDLFSLLQDNKEIGEFFDSNGHIHGGGWYATSDNGVTVEDFNGVTITVYNNFEGNLQKTQGLVIYEDKDFMIEGLRSGLDSYYWDDEEFAEEGVLSPSGKYNSIYRWITSDSQHFIIRTMDNSKPDFYIGVPTLEYKWINDDYILYLDFYSSLPFVAKVTDNEDESRLTNIFYEVGLIKDEDSKDEIGVRDFETVIVDGNNILIGDEDSGKKYKFRYEIDSNGKISFVYLNN